MTYKRQMAKPWRAPHAGMCLLKRGLCTPVPRREAQSQGPPTKAPSSPSTKHLPRLSTSPHPCSARLSPFRVKTLMYSLFSKRSPRGYKNSQQAPVSLRSLTFFHWEFVYSQP